MLVTVSKNCFNAIIVMYRHFVKIRSGCTNMQELFANVKRLTAEPKSMGFFTYACDRTTKLEVFGRYEDSKSSQVV